MASVSWISPPTPGCTPSSASKISRGEHVAAHDGEVRRGVLGLGLLDDAPHLHELVADDLGIDAAVGRDLLGGELREGDRPSGRSGRGP